MGETGKFIGQLEALYGSRKTVLYADYLQGPLSATYTRKDIKDIKNRLLKQERIIDRDVLSQLREMTVRAYNNPSPFVEQARRELQDFFFNGPTGHADQQIRSNNIALILYGSLQYGDPRNCDVDLHPVVIDGSKVKPEIRSLIWDLGISLEDYWINLSEFEGRRRSDPHFGYKIYDLAEYSNVGAIIENDPDFDNLTGFSAVISGVALFPQDQARVNDIQKRALKIAESDPLLCAIVNIELKNCLEERLARSRIQRRAR